MQKQNKIVLFDIDHTLFNTELYIDSLYKKLSEALGFEDINEFRNLARNVYSGIRKRTKFLPPKIFLKKILPHAKKSITYEDLNKLFWDKTIFEKSIYSDTLKAFDFLKKNNFKIGIFSTGDSFHQSIKIESLKEYLAQNHVYISEDKFEIIKSTLPSYKGYNAYLLDDLPEILHEAKLHNPEMKTILIKRENNNRKIVTPPDFKPDATITNFNKLIKIIGAEL